MKTKKRIVLTVAACLLAGGLAMAQIAPPQPPPGGPGGPGGLELLGRFFAFTETQAADLKQLLESQREAMRALHEQVAAKQKELHDLVAGGSTDAAAVGKLFLEVRALQNQIRDLHKSFREKFEQTLTTEQQEKLKAAQRAARLQPVVQALAGLQLIDFPRPPMRPGAPPPPPGN